MMKDKRVERSIGTASQELFDKFNGNTLFRFKGQDISFGETCTRVAERTGFLQKKGIAKGDVVGILSGNSPEWCSTFLAVTSIGAIALPLDTNLNKDQYNDMLLTAGAKAVFTGEGFHGKYKVPSFNIDYKKIDGRGNTLPEVSSSPDDIAVLLFTSGTTGTPKMVSLSHRNILHIAYVCTDLEEYTQVDQTLTILPLFHVYALESTFMAPFVTGSMIVMQNSLKGPDIMKSLADNDITIFPAAPIMWELFFNGIANKARAESERKYKLFMFLVNNAPLLRMLGLGLLLKKV
ncbi:MAG TPA: class I adenylate-forming enzyme family protein, partial [Spirochaetota bacterium]|nr:class I adenylate-forming enzyme family protein [Spirochaetota bacterium]